MDNNYEGWQTFLLNLLLKICCLGVQFGIVLHEEEKKIKNLIEFVENIYVHEVKIDGLRGQPHISKDQVISYTF